MELVQNKDYVLSDRALNLAISVVLLIFAATSFVPRLLQKPQIAKPAQPLGLQFANESVGVAHYASFNTISKIQVTPVGTEMNNKVSANQTVTKNEHSQSPQKNSTKSNEKSTAKGSVSSLLNLPMKLLKQL